MFDKSYMKMFLNSFLQAGFNSVFFHCKELSAILKAYTEMYEMSYMKMFLKSYKQDGFTIVLFQ